MGLYREALRIFVQITDGMNHAHVLGVLHRDLKPSNVMLSNPESASAEVKIVDFGIAKINKAEESSSLTQTGDVFGSPLYMSPEQTSGKKVDASHRIIAEIKFRLLAREWVPRCVFRKIFKSVKIFLFTNTPLVLILVISD